MSFLNGLKIAKPGFNAETCDVKDQVFNSQHNSLKVWMTGSVNISVSEYTGFVGTGIGDEDIAHNLGYSPFFICYFKLKHATKLWLQDSLDTSVIVNYVSGSAYSNNTNLNMNVRVNGIAEGEDSFPAFTAVGYYKILIDKAYE